MSSGANFCNGPVIISVQFLVVFSFNKRAGPWQLERKLGLRVGRLE